MASFDIAYKLTAALEGGWANHPLDRGGETYCGIARKFWPNWDGWKIIDQLKEPGDSVADINETLSNNALLPFEVKTFYMLHFWKPLGLFQDYISQGVANELYDTAVNQGVATAGMYLQKAINLLNQNGLLYKDLKEDGNVGPATLAAYQAIFLHYRSKYGILAVERVVVKALDGLQYERYKEICERDNSQEVFFFGWVMNRIGYVG